MFLLLEIKNKLLNKNIFRALKILRYLLNGLIISVIFMTAKSHHQSTKVWRLADSYFPGTNQLFITINIFKLFDLFIGNQSLEIYFNQIRENINFKSLSVGNLAERDHFQNQYSLEHVQKVVARVRSNPPRHFISWESSLARIKFYSALYLLICTDVNACEMRAARIHKDRKHTKTNA